MKRLFIFSNGVCFLEDDTANATFFDTNVHGSIFLVGPRILKLYTNKGVYRIRLEKTRFQIIDHINRWWIRGNPHRQLEKGDL